MSWSEHIEKLREEYIGRKVRYQGRIHTIVDVDYNGILHIDLPTELVNIIHCKNPRCITQTEHYVKPTFLLTDKAKGVYRCEYCDTLYLAGSERR